MKFEYVKGHVIIPYLGPLDKVEKYLQDLPIVDPKIFIKKRNKRSDFIQPLSILKATIFMQSIALQNYADIEENDERDIISLFVGATISQKSFLQKLYNISKITTISEIIDNSTVELLKKTDLKTTSYFEREYHILDLIAAPSIKNGYTESLYNGLNEYITYMAFLDDYALAFDLRHDLQESEKGAIEFLDRCILLTDKLGISRSDLLFRIDTLYNTSDFVQKCISNNINFIIKKNIMNEEKILHELMPNVKRNIIPRIDKKNKVKIYKYIDKEKPYGLNYDNLQEINVFTEEIKNEQLTFPVDPSDDLFGKEPWIKYAVESYFSNIKNFSDENTEYTNLFNDYKANKQFYTDEVDCINIKFLPNEYYKANVFILQLSAIVFTILKILGNTKLQQNSKKKNSQAISKIKNVIKSLQKDIRI